METRIFLILVAVLSVIDLALTLRLVIGGFRRKFREPKPFPRGFWRLWRKE